MINILLIALGALLGYSLFSFSGNRIFQFATTTNPYPSTTDPNIIRAVMQRDAAQAAQSHAEAQARMRAEGYVPREVAEGDITMQEYLASKQKKPSFAGIEEKPYRRYCHKVIYPEGEPICIYDIGELSPEQQKAMLQQVLDSFGFRRLKPISDDDPRWAQIEEYRRRYQKNQEQKQNLKDCYAKSLATIRTSGTSLSFGRGKNCPAVQPGITREQYINTYYRPISTADLDPLMKQIAVEEHGGIENYEYNRRRQAEVDKMISDYQLKKMEENNAKTDACNAAYKARYGPDEVAEHIAGAPQNDCYKLLHEGLGGDAPWIKAAKAQVLGRSSTTTTGMSSRLNTTLGAYGGRITKRRDYV